MVNGLLFILAGMPAVLFAAILFMFSRMFSQRELEILSKQEIIEISSSVIVLVLVFYVLFTNIGNNTLVDKTTCALFNAFMNYNESYSVTYNCDNFSTTEEISSILNDLYGAAQQSYVSSYTISTQFYRMSLLYLSVVVPQQSLRISFISKTKNLSTTYTPSLNPCIGYIYPYQEMSNFLLSNISLFSSSLITHIKLLEYINTIAVVFLAIGFFLRGFVFTRKFAGFLLAFAFALLLYPSGLFLFTGFVLYENGLYKIASTPSVNIYKMVINESDLNSSMGIYKPNDTLKIYPDRSIMACKYKTKVGLFRDDTTITKPALLMERILHFIINPSDYPIAKNMLIQVELLMAQGLAVLSVISISAGLGKILGVEISPWLLSNIARLRI